MEAAGGGGAGGGGSALTTGFNSLNASGISKAKSSKASSQISISAAAEGTNNVNNNNNNLVPSLSAPRRQQPAEVVPFAAPVISPPKGNVIEVAADVNEAAEAAEAAMSTPVPPSAIKRPVRNVGSSTSNSRDAIHITFQTIMLSSLF